MNGIKLEAGQWYRTRGGSIVRCVAGGVRYAGSFVLEAFNSAYYVLCDGKHVCGNANWDVVQHLPDCTGFDWEPQKPVVAPEGWEIVEEGVCKKGDRYLFCSGQTGTINIRVGEDVQDAKDAMGAVAIIRKIEAKYRPFANAEEFRPFRDKWVMSLGSEAISGGYERIISYDDHRVYVTLGECTVWWSYKDAMTRFTFEDGTPFGVEVS